MRFNHAHHGRDGEGRHDAYLKLERCVHGEKFFVNRAPEDWIMNKDRIKDGDPIIVDDCIDDVDRAADPMGRFYRHYGMHEGTVRMVLDDFGRCAYCVKLGFWGPDA